jgi:predicted CopG family antitoxin
MKRTTITISEEVHEALDDLKWEYHKRSYEDVVRLLLAHEGVEEFEDD